MTTVASRWRASAASSARKRAATSGSVSISRRSAWSRPSSSRAGPRRLEILLGLARRRRLVERVAQRRDRRVRVAGQLLGEQFLGAERPLRRVPARAPRRRAGSRRATAKGSAPAEIDRARRQRSTSGKTPGSDEARRKAGAQQRRLARSAGADDEQEGRAMRVAAAAPRVRAGGGSPGRRRGRGRRTRSGGSHRTPRGPERASPGGRGPRPRPWRRSRAAPAIAAGNPRPCRRIRRSSKIPGTRRGTRRSGCGTTSRRIRSAAAIAPRYRRDRARQARRAARSAGGRHRRRARRWPLAARFDRAQHLVGRAAGIGLARRHVGETASGSGEPSRAPKIATTRSQALASGICVWNVSCEE